jgi:pimeloyl-ACP methyl ester carboxylesterase
MPKMNSKARPVEYEQATALVRSPQDQAGAERRAKRVRKLPLIVLFSVLGFYAAAGYIGTSEAFGEHPEWRKMVATPEDHGLRAEVVSFSSTDGVALKAWWIPAQVAGGAAGKETAGTSSQPTVILAHRRDNNRSHMLPRASFLVHHGYNVLDVDLRCYGESQGKFITPGYLEALDILGAVNFLRRRIELGPLAVPGHSYRAVAALHAAAQSSEVAAVISDSAFMATSDILKRVAHNKDLPWKVRLGVWFARAPLLDRSANLVFEFRTGMTLDRNKIGALSAVNLIHQPVLFISGERDWLAPPENARLMLEAASNAQSRLFIVPGAGHSTTYKAAPQQYEAAVLSFLKQTLPAQSSPGRKVSFSENGRLPRLVVRPLCFTDGTTSSHKGDRLSMTEKPGYA